MISVRRIFVFLPLTVYVILGSKRSMDDWGHDSEAN